MNIEEINEKIKLYNEDCLEVLKTFDENSIDAIITDPPAGIAFMDSHWDDFGSGVKAKQNFKDFISQVAKELLRVIKPGGHALVWSLPKTSHWTADAFEDVGWEVRDCIYHIFGSGFPKSLNIGKKVDEKLGNERELLKLEKRYNEPSNKIVNTGEGERKKILRKITKGFSQWEGWGTALKPAVECWWLLRKPLSEKNIVDNVLKWGTGGLNIDGCRIECEVKEVKFTKRTVGYKDYVERVCKKGSSGLKPTNIASALPIGRYPSHLILEDSEEIKSLFPNQAYRFFYCAKASRKERDMGLIKEKNGGVYKFRQDGSLDNKIPIVKNNHPTVKPIKLMEYLVKLITPPEGVVLDPFMGSGTTGIACVLLDKKFIGIEKEKDYFEIAKARIKYYLEKNGGWLFDE